MQEYIDKAKTYIEEHGYLSFSKQCKNEYVVYCYHMNKKGSHIVLINKYHFKDKSDKNGKIRRKSITLPIAKFLTDTVIDLISRGYTIEY